MKSAPIIVSLDDELIGFSNLIGTGNIAFKMTLGMQRSILCYLSLKADQSSTIF